MDSKPLHPGDELRLPTLPLTVSFCEAIGSFAVGCWMYRAIQAVRVDLGLSCQASPDFSNSRSFCRQHAILQTIHTLPMDGRKEATGDEALNHMKREVVFPNPMA